MSGGEPTLLRGVPVISGHFMKHALPILGLPASRRSVDDRGASNGQKKPRSNRGFLRYSVNASMR
jgi:hypothetical protein